MSLASRIRARFNYLFPPAQKAPTPGPKATTSSPRPVRRRNVPNPIHPDFLGPVDLLWPIPEGALEENKVHSAFWSKKLHPHTAFGRQGFGLVAIPPQITAPIQPLIDGTSPGRLLV